MKKPTKKVSSDSINEHPAAKIKPEQSLQVSKITLETRVDELEKLIARLINYSGSDRLLDNHPTISKYQVTNKEMQKYNV